MKLFSVLSILIYVATGISAQSETNEKDLAKYVDPFWGAAEHPWTGGHTFAGAAIPHGMVKLGPDCNKKITNSGYDREGKIHGFSHVHTTGSGGNPKYGNVLVMATSGEMNLTDYASDRANETARPGYFGVDYTTWGVKAEFTVTQSVGFHQYTFGRKGRSNIIFDLGSYLSWIKHDWTQEFVGSEVQILSDREIQGHTRIRKGWGKGNAYTVYFYGILDTPAQNSGTWKSGILHPDSKGEADTMEPVGAYFSFQTEQTQVVSLKVGISFLGVEKAKENIKKECSHWDFDKVRTDAYKAWNRELNKIRVENENQVTREIFYSALYHALLQPTMRTGENPNWNTGKPYYDDFFCIWDTFRATHPLYTLINSNRQVDMVNTLLDVYVNEGYMPDARSGNCNGMTQGGSNCDVLIADAWIKGLKGIDYELALQAMIKNAEVPPGGNEDKEGRGGLTEYSTIGYVTPKTPRAGSRTMEYTFNDYCIATVAYGLGKNDIADKYFRRANNWKNIWYSPVEDEGAKGFVIPREADGTWRTDWNLHAVGSLEDWLYEGNSWEYSLYVPHDVAELIHYCGGPALFEQRLDTFFIKKSVSTNPYTSGYYNVSNEPSFLTPLLYNYIGKPWKSAERIRHIIAESYRTGIDGLPGNEDSGSMSAWYIFHTMGFYPVAGTDVYLISTPVVSTSLTLENGKKINIRAILPERLRRGEQAIYIQSCKFNGQPCNKSWFRHSDIVNGAEIEFVMGTKPSAWATNGELPPSMSERN